MTSNILSDFPSEDEMKKLVMHTSATVWKHEITEREIENWLSNFVGEVHGTDEERVLALWLLSNFVYYNDDEVRHLCVVLLRDYLHRAIIQMKGAYGSIKEAIGQVISHSRFISLGKPSESGGFILYYFRQVNDLSLSNFLVPTNDDMDIENVVFVDDVTLTAGSDGQAYSFLERFRMKDKRNFLLTFVASNKAIDSLTEIGIEVISPIVLDSRNRCFTEHSLVFDSYQNHLEEAKGFVSHYGRRAKKNMPFGYEDGQYLFGFFYNTPDNTLPIFWSSEGGWRPIMKRYDKNYYSKLRAIKDDRFI